MIILGVDTGGTFTDFVVLENDRLRVHKVLSTPASPEEAIFQGIEALKLRDKPLTVIHGSTVATNAALEGKGVKTAYIANTGLKDVLTIGRQARPRLYELQPEAITPPVPESLCLEIDCRLAADGGWITRLSEQAITAVIEKLKAHQVESVAINLLFSYLDDSAEQALKDRLPEDLFISLSSEVLSEINEYERGMATWLNAWIGPLIQGYVNRLKNGLMHGDNQCRLSVMQSSGETMDSNQAATQAVRMLLSGPAGGLVGAQYVAAKSDFSKIMTFDMGGTSTDVALIDGPAGLQLTNQGKIGPYPVAVPMVDMHTIGAGGGSIASLDAGGMLQVGPQSAGAAPGPACYGQGGEFATVTDANLLLGRIPADALLGGYMQLDMSRAKQVIQQLADKMDISLHQAAQGIVDIANEHMARALRVISVQKGYDPAEFTLVSFGGAGGMHVCALAEKLQMNSALVPVNAGVLSALGMLATRPGRQLSHTMIVLLKDVQKQQLLDAFEALSLKGRNALLAEGIPEKDLQAFFSLDLRYQGQSNALNIKWTKLEDCEQAFHHLHEKRYGHRLQIPVELVNIRVNVVGKKPGFKLQQQMSNKSGFQHDQFTRGVPIYAREQLGVSNGIEGPAIIVEPVATTWVAHGWHCQMDKTGNLLLKRS